MVELPSSLLDWYCRNMFQHALGEIMYPPTRHRESPKTLAQVVKVIEGMGSSYAVAHMLHDHQMKGFRYHASDSALSRWIRLETGADRCDVNSQEIEVVYSDDRSDFVYTPPELVDFERRFDRGEFPSLVETGVSRR